MAQARSFKHVILCMQHEAKGMKHVVLGMQHEAKCTMHVRTPAKWAKRRSPRQRAAT
jgi:hypothetical protein